MKTMNIVTAAVPCEGNTPWILLGFPHRRWQLGAVMG